jgi:hypothetical protein
VDFCGPSHATHSHRLSAHRGMSVHSWHGWLNMGA